MSVTLQRPVIRFDVSHLDSHSQPISFVNPLANTYKKTATKTAAQVEAAALAAATPVTGQLPTQMGRCSSSSAGESALNHTVQDNFKWKLGYDLTPTIHAAYTLDCGRTTIRPF